MLKLATRVLVGMLRSSVVPRCWLAGFLCAGCASDPAIAGPVGGVETGGTGGGDAPEDILSAGAGGSGARGPARTPDFCYGGSLETYCGPSGCPPLRDHVAQLLEDPPQELWVLPCGDGSSDAGSAGDTGDAGLDDAGHPGARYVAVLSTTGTNTEKVYYDTLSGQAVGTTRTESPFTACAPMYPVFGEFPGECTVLDTERCPPRDVGADLSASPYVCVLVELPTSESSQ
jgi:hypothetical protein